MISISQDLQVGTKIKLDIHTDNLKNVSTHEMISSDLHKKINDTYITVLNGSLSITAIVSEELKGPYYNIYIDENDNLVIITQTNIKIPFDIYC